MKYLRKDLEYEIYKLDKSLKIKDISHILALREQAVFNILQGGNTLKDGKLTTYSYQDKPAQRHYNQFADKDTDKIIVLPPRRVYKVEYLPLAKKKLDHYL